MKVKAIPCEVYSRIVGYYRPIRSWNPGKQAEYLAREMVDVGTGGELQPRAKTIPPAKPYTVGPVMADDVEPLR